MICTRKPTAGDVAELARNLRPESAAEFEALGAYSPLAGIEDAVMMSKGSAWVTYVDGELLAIWGVVDSEGVGIPWIVTSRFVEHHKKIFLRLCKDYLAVIRQEYPKLASTVDARHARAIRLAHHLGFAVKPAVEAGVNGERIHTVELGG